MRFTSRKGARRCRDVSAMLFANRGIINARYKGNDGHVRC